MQSSTLLRSKYAPFSRSATTRKVACRDAADTSSIVMNSRKASLSAGHVHAFVPHADVQTRGGIGRSREFSTPDKTEQDATRLRSLDMEDLVQTDLDKIPGDIATSVHAIILAGGSSRSPLAKSRAIPALPLGGSYRLIDVAIGNCLRGGINKLHVLTQFNSHHLNSYLAATYPPLSLGGMANASFVDCIACTQTPESKEWSKGSADAVRRALPHLSSAAAGLPVPEDVLVITGQDVYDMDFGRVVAAHRRTGADATVITARAPPDAAKHLGLCEVHPVTGRIQRFTEKAHVSDASKLKFSSPFATPDKPFEASMGMYVFKRSCLETLLQLKTDETTAMAHFGFDVMPRAVEEGFKVMAYHYEGDWNRCSSLKEYMDLNLSLATCEQLPEIFDFMRVISSGRSLPPSRFTNVSLESCLIGEGSVLRGGRLRNTVVGVNSYIDDNADIENCMINGLDTFHSQALHKKWRAEMGVAPGIGHNALLRNCIVDSNACVGNDVELVNRGGVVEADLSEHGVLVQDGIIIVQPDSTVPDGFSF